HGQQSAVRDLIERGQPFIPCYWHQQNLLCAIYLMDLKAKSNFNPARYTVKAGTASLDFKSLNHW
ncbi:MAG TPA: hypothetical protein VII92_19995, partial [Anaerolineae bacterium]